MLGKLITYELAKRWKTSKLLLLGYVMVQTVILLVTRVFLWNDNISRGFYITGGNAAAGGDVNITGGNGISATFLIMSMVFLLFALFIGAYPFIESIYRYERDLSGKQAYLELMIPAVGWMKVLAKLIATIVSFIIYGTLSLLSMFLFFMINSNFRYLMDMVRQLLTLMSDNGLKVVLIILFMLFSFASAYMTIFFCISVAKSFTHKNTVAVPIGILIFIIITSCIGLVSNQLDGLPIATWNIGEITFTLSSLLLDIVLFLVMLAGTSWLIEKKIEH